MEIDNKNKKRILIGIIITLILINLTALGTLGYSKYKRDHNKKIELQQANKKVESKEDRIKQFVKRELHLDDKQCSIYFKSMDSNFAQTKRMLDKIQDCKKLILDQTISENPDTLILSKLCDSLGSYHCNIQKSTNRHFIEMLVMLDSSQKVRLKEILIKMNEGDWKKGEKKHQN